MLVYAPHNAGRGKPHLSKEQMSHTNDALQRLDLTHSGTRQTCCSGLILDKGGSI